ncbi:hypothetical protein DLAC_10078 [Tieghemostelium lacteum]|uniref:THUMP domain-containing protein n=1 Tax=Tieghemostelium lacteum TaxID=361077 RepID=A0A151Z661_TIELA|nr:hypothetical protein DLAC_10078 [Tieghemostelium lacteum]|eukprot:KYQ89417.1 hypothetical protein DLAC_10078 [Tieghemostelium lacteum]
METEVNKKRALEVDSENQASNKKSNKQIKLDSKAVVQDDDDILNKPESERLKNVKKPSYHGKFRNYKKHTALYASEKKVKGILVTCEKNKEPNSIGEILPILKEFAQKYFPKSTKPQQGGKEKVEEEDEEEISTAVHEPTEDGNGTGESGVKHFSIINSGCSGIYFIQLTHPTVDPTDFITSIFVDIYQRKIKKVPEDSPYRAKLKFIQDNLLESTKQMIKDADQSAIIQNKLMAKLRFTYKMIPIIGTSKVEAPMVTEMAKEVMKKLNNIKPKTFAVEYRSRNDNTVKRDELIKEVASLADSTIKVDLKNPELTVIIEIIKTCVTMGVVTLFDQLYKFNIKELCCFNPNHVKPPPKVYDNDDSDKEEQDKNKL